MHRSLLRLIPLLLVALLVGLKLPHVKADPTEVYIDLRVHNDLTILHWADFIPPYGDAAVADGTWSSGTGYQTTFTAVHGGGTIDAQYLYVQIPDLGGALEASLENVTQLTVYTDGIGLSGYEDLGGGGHAPDFSAADGSGRGTTGYVWTSISNFGGARFWSSYAASSTQYTWITGIAWEYDCTEDCGGGTLTRPLTSDDEIDTNPLYDQTAIFENPVSRELFPVLNNGGIQTVSAWSDAPGAKVHAADAGSIVSVHPLTWEDCGIAYASPTSVEDDTPVYVPFGNEQEQPCLVGYWPDLESALVFNTYWLDVSNASIVTLQIGSGEKIQYLVRNADDYVVVGDTVDVGCVLGETIPSTSSPTAAINFKGIAVGSAAVGTFTGVFFFTALGAAAAIIDHFFPPAPPAPNPHGYTSLSLYAEDDSIEELASQLTVEPTNTDNCNNTGEFANCLAFNPRFTNQGNGWVASGNVEWTEPGVILDPGESITATINLSSTGDYTATAFAQSENGLPGQLRIYLGSHTDRYAAPLEWTSLQLAAEPVGEPDAGTFYSVGVQNTGTSRVEVMSLCVTDGAPDTGPNSCYFNNQSFVEGISGWTVSEGVEESDEALNVPDDGIISQNVHLFPQSGGPATYKLLVRGDWWYTGTDTPSSAEAIASVKYEYPDGTGYHDMVPINITANLAYGAGQLAYIAEIEVSSETDDLINIKVQTTDAGDFGVLGIRLTDACLSTMNGGGFPGQSGDGAPPPIDVNCTYVSRPQNNDPAAWLNWHWAKSEQFFNCKLMVLLNKMYVLGQQSYTLAGWQARYAQSTMKMWSSWLGSQFFPWLGGHFRNMAIGQVTTIYSDAGPCSNLFCVLEAAINGLITPLNNIVNALLGILGNVTGILFDVIRAIIILVISFITQALNLLLLAQQLLGSLIAAYNSATPVAVPGLPTCNLDPRSSPFCMGIWVLDNTIFSGTGSAIIPALVAVFSIHILLWVIAEIKRTVLGVGSAAT